MLLEKKLVTIWQIASHAFRPDLVGYNQPLHLPGCAGAP
jgi:hypothetical protein